MTENSFPKTDSEMTDKVGMSNCEQDVWRIGENFNGFKADLFRERKNEEEKFVKTFRECPSTVATDLSCGNDAKDNARHYSLLCPLPIENGAMFKRKT